MAYDVEKLIKVSALKTLAEKIKNDYVTQKELNTKISSVYKPQGSITSSKLLALTPSEDNLGYVYNLSDELTSDERFLDSSGKTYPPGTNVAIVEEKETERNIVVYKFDILSGIVDLNGYLKDSNVASDDEVNEMLETLFPTT